jgi:hypothetical protein
MCGISSKLDENPMKLFRGWFSTLDEALMRSCSGFHLRVMMAEDKIFD